MANNLVTILPNAASLIESMRSIGYSFETAIADIIDNSISANASEIDIFQRNYQGLPYIQIIDNGIGMNNRELIEAMRLGSKNPNEIRDKDDLGRFGLGLKSSSFSQCKLLTVISKKDELIRGYRWDLDLVQKTDSFDVIMLSEKEINSIPNIEDLKKLSSGTIIQWQEFDRIENATNNLDSELADLMNKAADHIALIFHRFISDGLDVQLNYETVKPKDPYLVNHSGTQELKDKVVTIKGGDIHLYPYVLPHYSKLSAEDKRRVGKADEQYKRQGFYLYRNKRLIVWGDYLGLSRKSELSKNLRIKVDIPNNLDYLWEIDVRKSRARVPSIIKRNLLSAINDGETISKNVNTYRGKKELQKNNPIWSFLTDREDGFHLEVNPTNELFNQFTSTLDREQQKLFNIYLRALADNVPYQSIYGQISDGKDNYVDVGKTELDELKDVVEEMKKSTIIDIKIWLKTLLSQEPYISNKDIVDYINKEMSEFNG